MRILFVMKHPAALRSLEGVVRMLAERDHEVHLVFAGIKTGESHASLRELAIRYEKLTFGELPRRDRSALTRFSTSLRRGIDFLRYLEPVYANAPKLRARAEESAPASVRRLGYLARAVGGGAGLGMLRRSLQTLERCLEPPARVVEFLEAQRPDLLLATHLVTGQGRADYVRAAKRLGIKTAYPVFSWDNLTNKGVIHELPDAVLVWNELQAREAVEMHGVPPDRVHLTGAPAYDHWFSWAPGRSRAEFCRLVGLRPDRPFVLYVCSSAFIAPDEVAFVRRWVDAVRSHGGSLAEAGILVRPHPRNAGQWAGVRLDRAQVAVWPPLGQEPVDSEARANYFDSLYHSAAVVGINTSAQIEGAVVGRPVHTVLADEFRETQEGTLHFHYLQAEEFGHLHVARTLAEHAAQLEASLRGEVDPARNERFLRHFIRPLGLDVPATPRVVEALEELAALEPAPAHRRRSPLAPLVAATVNVAALARSWRPEAARPLPPAKPSRQARLLLRKLVHDPAGTPIVAGPWNRDEVGELLYWIPFLRWAQSLFLTLPERLVVVSPRENAFWYEGIGTAHLAAEELAGASDALIRDRLAELFGQRDFHHFPPDLVDAGRAYLALRQVQARPAGRRLEFAPLAAPAPEIELELPEQFVAVRFGFEAAFPEADVAAAEAVIAALTAQGPVVALDTPRSLMRLLEQVDVQCFSGGHRLRAAVVARSRAFVGDYGATAFVAALLGVPAVALYTRTDAVDSRSTALAASALVGPRYGELCALAATASPGEVAARVVGLLERDDRRMHPSAAPLPA